ncbi:SDR family NAD(P)-dependent oxidoreductase [Actinomycetospora flava]|uniref:SDR family NAD(P)-dependent oxidoreductase n=1 Tax=Actinomycetospora flava TaxID=3129232 RepID=A0ABU8M8J1_9PSEU
MSGRVSIVTGAGGALGTAIARRLHGAGDVVVLADVDRDAASRASARIGWSGADERLRTEQVDVADPDSVQRLVDRVGAGCGRIDVVVNNAAIQRRGGIAALRTEDWDEVHRVDLRGPMLLCRAVHPYWERQRAGSVVNIASRVWLSGGAPIYVAAKAGLVGLTRSLATELAPHGVTANAVAPGFVATAFTRRGHDEQSWSDLVKRQRRITPLGTLTEPEDVAQAVAFLASPAARTITGEVLHVCGGAQLAPLP